MKYEEAIDRLQLAIEVLKKRIDNLVKKTESVDDSKKNDAFYTREKEIAELEASTFIILTNQKSVFKILTNQSSVFRIFTFQKYYPIRT